MHAKIYITSGLVAFYDIRPGNGAGLFLQPQNPHGASDSCDMSDTSCCKSYQNPREHFFNQISSTIFF